MAQRTEFIGHATSAANTFTGLGREVTLDTTKNTIRVHDGVTVGGFELARANASNIQDATASQNGRMTTAQVVQLATNVSDIATNTAAIATNAGNIATNAAAISTNTANIATNTSAIAANTANISSNASAIAANTADISTNTANIAATVAATNTNTSNISTNIANIATNASNIATNSANTATNTADIATNTVNISTNTTNIATNLAAINGNTANIATKAAKVAGAVNGHFAGLNTSGDLTDSGSKSADFAVSSHTHTLATITDSGTLAGLNATTQATTGTSSVGQGQLRATTSTHSVGVNSQVSATISITGGIWGWLTSFSSSSSNNETLAFGGGNTAAGTFGFYNFGLSSYTAYVDSTYITASPPYDLGDGEIPLFVYVLVENGTRKVLATSVAPDPHWAYNGPTKVFSRRFDEDKNTGKIREFGMIEKPGARIIKTLREAIAQKKVAEFKAQRMDKTRFEEVELDMAFKMRDVNATPHPFMDRDLSDKTVILLDPVGSDTEMLAIIHNDGENISKIITDGDILFDNTTLNRKAPPGVMPVGFRWKLTK